MAWATRASHRVDSSCRSSVGKSDGGVSRLRQPKAARYLGTQGQNGMNWSRLYLSLSLKSQSNIDQWDFEQRAVQMEISSLNLSLNGPRRGLPISGQLPT